MSLLTEIALAVAGLSLAAVYVYWMVVAWQRVIHDDGPLPVFNMIKMRQLSPEGLAAVANAANLAPAVRRCMFCRSKEQCRAWCASGKQGERPAYCPNDGLFEQMHA